MPQFVSSELGYVIQQFRPAVRDSDNFEGSVKRGPIYHKALSMKPLTSGMYGCIHM